MTTRASLLGAALLGAAINLTGSAVTGSALAAPPAEAGDPYRCHPSEDIACTVVRETPRGMVIVTMRPTGPQGTKPVIWSVVSGPPPGAANNQVGGTVYVVPVFPEARPIPPVAIQPMPANGAPILD